MKSYQNVKMNDLLMRNNSNILQLAVLVKDLCQRVPGAVRERQVLHEQLVLLRLGRVLERRLGLLRGVAREEHRPPVQRHPVVFYGFVYRFL